MKKESMHEEEKICKKFKEETNQKNDLKMTRQNFFGE